MKKYIAIALLYSGGVAAQTATTTTITAPAPTTTTSGVGLRPVGGLKSTTNLARESEVRLTDKRAKSKNEMFLGVTTNPGWGGYGQITQSLNARSDRKTGDSNSFTASDFTVSLQHPLYQSDRMRITGQFRQYFPTSQKSEAKHTWQHAYYSRLNYKFPNKFDLNNELIPRYYTQPDYKKTDTMFLVENYTGVSRPIASWAKVALTHHVVAEAREGAAAGRMMEIYPSADFTVNKNISFGPRVYFPILKVNDVSDGPRDVSMANVMGEFYLQATL